MFCFSSIRGHILRATKNECLSNFAFDQSRKISYSPPLTINMTPSLMALPMKRKKKIDPMILKKREEKKKKKILKEISCLEKLEKIQKPSEEFRLPKVLYENPETRRRDEKFTEEEELENILLRREFCRAKAKEAKHDLKQINNLVLSSEKALNELKQVSQSLYEAAIKIDDELIPFKFEGPRETPPIEGYEKLDGEFIDISKKWM